MQVSFLWDTPVISSEVFPYSHCQWLFLLQSADRQHLQLAAAYDSPLSPPAAPRTTAESMLSSETLFYDSDLAIFHGPLLLMEHKLLGFPNCGSKGCSQYTYHTLPQLSSYLFSFSGMGQKLSSNSREHVASFLNGSFKSPVTQEGKTSLVFSPLSATLGASDVLRISKPLSNNQYNFSKYHFNVKNMLFLVFRRHFFGNNFLIKNVLQVFQYNKTNFGINQ